MVGMTDDARPALEGMSQGSGEDAPRWRERQVAAVAELGLLALQESDTDAVLDFAAERLRDALGCDFSMILDSRVSATGIVVRSGSGWPGGILGQVDVPGGSGSQAGYTLETGGPVIVDDLLAERRFTPVPLFLEQGIRSGISVLINGDPEPYGVLEADSRSAGWFGPEDTPIVQAYADVLSIVMDQREREQLSADFAAIASHELRTPLTLLMGYSSRLLRRLDHEGVITPEQRDVVELLYSESLRLRRAIDIFLALGEVERRSVAPGVVRFDLVETVASAATEVAERYPDSVIEIAPASPSLDWASDEVAVQRIISNLIENGVKYSPTGAQITVQVALDGDVGDRDATASVRVLDHCGGLADDDLRRLFGRSFRGRHAYPGLGLGLGLYVAQRLALRVGGSLAAENEGDGCVFTLRLPSLDAAPGDPGRVAGVHRPDGRS